MPKKLLLLLLIVSLFAGGAWWYAQKTQKQVIVPPKQEMISQVPNTQEETTKDPNAYSQHIEAISGNTDEVWYNIPEYGIRMRLNKEFAEDLVYQVVHEKNIRDEEWNTVYFSVKSILKDVPDCSGALGAMSGGKGDARELAKHDDSIVQVGEYYYSWQGPQDACWGFDLEEEVSEIRSGKRYVGSGAKNIREGIKTIQLVPKK